VTAPAQRPPTITGGHARGTSIPLWAVLLATLALSCVLGLGGESLVGRARRLVRPPRRYESRFREGPAERTDDHQASPPPTSAPPVEDDGSLSASVKQLRPAAALWYEAPKLHAVIEPVTTSGEWRPLALATAPSSRDEPAAATLARPQAPLSQPEGGMTMRDGYAAPGNRVAAVLHAAEEVAAHHALRPFRSLVSTMSRWGHSPMDAVVGQTEQLSLSTEAGVSDVDKVTKADLPREGSLGVGDRVGASLAAAEEDADRMRREVDEETAAIRRQTERALSAGSADLAKEIERIKSEAVAAAQSLREEAERDAAERLRSASEEAAKVLARADAKANARRASAAEAARLVDEAQRRQAVLKEATDALEERLRTGVEGGLHAAHEGLLQLSSSLEELLGEKARGDKVANKKAGQRAG
jgi:hypothetical protein